MAEALDALLKAAALHYARDEVCAGCLVLEGIRCQDQQAREAARVFHRAAEDTIRCYCGPLPQDAQRLTDFVSTVMSGLSARARQGHSVEQLLASAQLAGLAVAAALEA